MTIDTKRLATDAAYWDSVAPEGATHYDSEFEFFCTKNGFWNAEGDWFNVNPSEHYGWGTSRYIPRPQAPGAEWVDGLPPVGWKGELKGSLDDCEIVSEWLGGRVYYNEFTEKFAWTDSGRIFSTKEQRERDELAHLLCPALRQLRHNSSDSFVPAFDYEETLAILSRYNLEPKQ